ncbi:MAG: transporter substrate-binding domain-containing protein [Acidobacteria bacterium]|nr:transporter substrate-binding domain-containing protein [Acidobacteriota bacterium]
MKRPGARGQATAAALLLAFGVAGCDEGSDTPPTSPTAPTPAPAPAVPAPIRCAEEGRVLEFGFFALYEPISYRAGDDPMSAAFDEHLGYEADLLTALEAMDGAGLSFNRRGIDAWPGIWLLPAGPDYDLVGGGITILEERTRDASGAPAVAFTSGHVTFRHSLLVRGVDAAELAEYSDLTSEARVGVSMETTGESRFLQIVGLVDEDGALLAGTSVTTPEGVVVADGSEAFRIAASGSSENLAGRSELIPPSPGYPQVVFFGAESVRSEHLLALLNREVDALAGDEIGNRAVEQVSAGLLVVTALDTEVEHGGFALDQSEEILLACLDDKLDYLTGEREIGYAEWLANPSVFLERAEAWTP